MTYKWFLYFGGYVKIKISGYSTERFINLCKNHQIEVWNIQNYGKYQILYMKSSSVLKLAPFIRKTKTRIVILKKYGLPFFMHKYRKRKIFFFGIVISLLILYIMSFFIWNIEINGNYSRTTEFILLFLKENGIDYGMLKKNVYCEEIEAILREEYDDVIWASARVEGTCLIIHIKENKTEEIPVSTISSDLIASEDGIVESIVTRTGTPLVTVGDNVSENQILISGAVPIYDDFKERIGCNYVCADGDILVRSKYEYHDTIPSREQQEILTGKKLWDGKIKAGPFQCHLKLPWIPYQLYHVKEEQNRLHVSKYFYLPLCFTKVTYEEYVIKDFKRSEDVMKELCYRRLEKFIMSLEEKGIQIIGKDVKIQVLEHFAVMKGELLIDSPQTRRQSVSCIEIMNEEAEHE